MPLASCLGFKSVMKAPIEAQNSHCLEGHIPLNIFKKIVLEEIKKKLRKIKN